MKLGEKTLSVETIYDGRIIRVERQIVELPNGKTAPREIVRHADAVAVLAIDEENNVFLVEQFRKPIDCVIYEIPAGLVEPGEDPMAAAARELEEECGMAAGKLELLTKFYTTPGFSDERIWLYKATELVQSHQHMDEDELVNVIRMPAEEFAQKARTGEFTDGKTILAYGFLNT